MGKCGEFVRLIVLAALLPGTAAAACRGDQVEIRGDWGAARFTVEVADDEAERNRGLMQRANLPASSGMLFVYDAPVRASFWMKNTLIPLDMIFMNRRGVVEKVHAMAEPMSTKNIVGGWNIQYVLEINGGLAARLGIGEGSVMRHPAVAQDDAAWPC